MDILKFINSKDIREHLKTINYEFNSLEAAWLIYQSRATIEEKHNAWRELIETMPDCEVPRRMNTEPQKSLHQYLEYYISKENDILNDFIKDKEHHIFEYWYFDTDCDFWINSDDRYYNFDKCFKDAIKECRECGFRKFKMIKREINTSHSVEVVFFDERVYDYTILCRKYYEHHTLYEVFDGLWFAFPTPFQKGDILCEYDMTGTEIKGFCAGPFVMKRITTTDTHDWVRKCGDNSDMNAWGYFIDDNGSLYSETMDNYMNLEFYRGDLKGKKRVLKALSNFIAGEIDITLFANTYHYILCEENLKQNMPQGYTDEGLSLAGIKD